MKNYSPKTTPPAKTTRYKNPTQPIGVYYYGKGKGKTTAALGTVLRAAGWGRKVLVLQAVKGDWPSGEQAAINRDMPDLVTIQTLGRGFVGILGDKLARIEHEQAAQSTLVTIRSAIHADSWDLIVLDEATDIIELNLTTIDMLLEAINDFRSYHADLIITGHRYFPELAALADIVTEMKSVKHHFDNGVLAKKGLDF